MRKVERLKASFPRRYKLRAVNDAVIPDVTDIHEAQVIVWP